MSCRSSEFMENMFSSLRNSYKFEIVTSPTSSSPKMKNIRPPLFFNHWVSCSKMAIFLGVLQPAEKCKESWLHFAKKRYLVSTWKIFESSSGKFKKLNILFLFRHASPFKIQKIIIHNRIKLKKSGEKSNYWRHKVFLRGLCEK